MNDEKPFRLRPRRLRRQEHDESKTWSKAFKGLIRVVRMSTKSRRAFGASRGRQSRTSTRSQRCAVRLTYSPNRVKGQWAAHGRYLMRDGATEPAIHDGAPGFDSCGGGIDIATRLRSWQSAGDARIFKLIVSPELGERLDLNRLVRDLMQRMEQDLGRKLEWVAVNHFNTAHPHAHIALRGVAQGQELRLDRDYVKHGIRRHAEELCTQELGFRTFADALEAERREIDQPRITSLDRQIARHRRGEAGPSFSVEIDSHIRPNLVKRLAVLQTTGLAQRATTKTWNVRSDFEAVLRTMQTVTDRQRMVAAHAKLLSDPRLPIQYTPAAAITKLEGRVIVHALDEHSGKTYMILESVDGIVHLIPHDRSLEQSRSEGKFAPDSFVHISKAEEPKRSIILRDYGDAERYLRSLTAGQLRRKTLSATHTTPYGGWLGRYWKALAMRQVRPNHRNSRIEEIARS